MTNTISLLLCLFLCATQTFYTFPRQDYEQRARQVTFEEAVSLSAQIQEDMNECLKIENVEAEIEFLCQEEIKKLKLSIQELNEQKEAYALQQEEFLHKSSLSKEDLACIEQLERTQREMIEQKKTLKDVQSNLYKIQKQVLPIRNQRIRDQEAQKILEERFMERIPEMNGEGEYDVHKVIGGSKNLPVYGGQKAFVKSNNVSCLVAGDFEIDTFSEYWIYPIQGGIISAGTWSYPNGAMHLGMDYAVPLYTSLMAPANGLILYANNPVSSNCGYLGNMCGWPYGGGNTIAMICAVAGSIYGVTFAHLSNNIYVYAGQQVGQGQVIAQTGNSGNSTGPHCHIEVFTLGTDLETVVNYFASTADFAFGCGWSAPATCSGYGCRVRPEVIL